MKNTVVAIVLAVWALAMAKAILLDKHLPDVTLWGIPGAVYVLVNPPLPAKAKVGEHADH